MSARGSASLSSRFGRSRSPVVPYANREFNPGINIDFYALGNIFLGISTTAGAINFIVTTWRTRCPGMSVNRFPIVIWGTLTANAGNVLAIPVVSLAFFLLWLDRQFGTHFYNAANGGQPLLWRTCSGCGVTPGSM